MARYAWCEDSGSGYRFWREVFQTLYPDVAVESKSDNSRLRKAASAVEDDGNEYYILMDSFLDNADAMREIDGLRRSIAGKKNVRTVDVRSFEFALLSFRLLEQWVFAEEDELRDGRESVIRAKDLFLEQFDAEGGVKSQTELLEVFPYAKSHNSEQVAAALLYGITRNTGFETTKGKLGYCFVGDCCEWTMRQPDDLCGLDETKPGADEKKRLLVSESMLQAAFEKAGL